jgi:hypothetical protein
VSQGPPKVLQKGSNLRKKMYYGLYPLMASSLAYRVEIKAINKTIATRQYNDIYVMNTIIATMWDL